MNREVPCLPQRRLHTGLRRVCTVEPAPTLYQERDDHCGSCSGKCLTPLVCEVPEPEPAPPEPPPSREAWGRAIGACLGLWAAALFALVAFKYLF